MGNLSLKAKLVQTWRQHNQTGIYGDLKQVESALSCLGEVPYDRENGDERRKYLGMIEEEKAAVKALAQHQGKRPRYPAPDRKAMAFLRNIKPHSDKGSGYTNTRAFAIEALLGCDIAEGHYEQSQMQERLEIAAAHIRGSDPKRGSIRGNIHKLANLGLDCASPGKHTVTGNTQFWTPKKAQEWDNADFGGLTLDLLTDIALNPNITQINKIEILYKLRAFASKPELAEKLALTYATLKRNLPEFGADEDKAVQEALKQSLSFSIQEWTDPQGLVKTARLHTDGTNPYRTLIDILNTHVGLDEQQKNALTTTMTLYNSQRQSVLDLMRQAGANVALP